MIDDKLPELTEEFSLSVIRANGDEETTHYSNGKPTLTFISVGKIDALAKEILHERRRNHQT